MLLLSFSPNNAFIRLGSIVDFYTKLQASIKINIISLKKSLRSIMNHNTVPSQHSSDKVEISIHLDSELLEQIKHLTNDPSRVIETAIKQWLKGEREPEDDLSRTFRRNPPVPPKGEWND